jgi:hypothetical protein
MANDQLLIIAETVEGLTDKLSDMVLKEFKAKLRKNGYKALTKKESRIFGDDNDVSHYFRKGNIIVGLDYDDLCFVAYIVTDDDDYFTISVNDDEIKTFIESNFDY